jgi:hypothetical protein
MYCRIIGWLPRSFDIVMIQHIWGITGSEEDVHDEAVLYRGHVLLHADFVSAPINLLFSPRNYDVSN